MLPEEYNSDSHDPTNWLISPIKEHRVRALWNKETLVSKHGYPFYPPQWFKDMLPKDLALDGELWLNKDVKGDELYKQTICIIRS